MHTPFVPCAPPGHGRLDSNHSVLGNRSFSSSKSFSSRSRRRRAHTLGMYDVGGDQDAREKEDGGQLYEKYEKQEK
jgi:hypothetical protein